MTKHLYDNYFETRVPFMKDRDKMWKPIVEYLQRKYIPKTSIVLDLGAGYCNFINNVVAKEKHANDLSPIIKKYAAKGVKLYIQDCTKLNNISKNKFDVVFAAGLLEHLDLSGIEQLLTHVHRILRPGGFFISMQPNFTYFYKNYFDDYTHKTILTHEGVKDLLQNYNFEIEKIEPKFLPATLKERLPRIPFLVKLYLLSPWRPKAGQMLAVAKKPVGAPLLGDRRNSKKVSHKN